MPKADNFRALPKRITETLVRAFAGLPAVNTDVLILQPVTEPRAPLWETKERLQRRLDGRDSRSHLSQSRMLRGP